jgi:IclR family KDG regulon transcriptional repressor
VGQGEQGDEKGASERLDTTLVKGLRILECLAEASDPLGVSALSDILGIGRSNMHRLLKTLAATGYVAQEPRTRRYLATLKLWEQGSVIAERSRLRRAARPVLRNLNAETGEVVFLSILHGSDILYVDKIDPVVRFSTAARAGLRVPAVYTASGKALLAHQPNCAELVNESLTRLNSFDANQRADLLKEMETIAEDGCAYSFSGWTAHAQSVAVVVPNADFPPVAAIGTMVLKDGGGGSLARMRRFVPMLQRSAAELGAAVAPIVNPM